ncbi:SWIM zinc finger family protein [Streptomyces oryzae]|uniref:SWIM zinc finger family protein n=1 Tax=Streptomyces oryzae TaxID=1434886 RepID=A0ABS3X5X4_9ACTN|nr:SWIM zinc finger family protein [Streptomyces oryzae]MBO8190768.1 SWIM zinc finger family protein [Streptomyces oryzae]
MTESWGAAWLRAMEGAARDAARLERGRAYAVGDRLADRPASRRAGQGQALDGAGGVSAVRVGPGRVTAFVHGSRSRPYRAEWRLPVLSEEEWGAFLAAVADRPVDAAALLDGEVGPGVAATARSAGVQLLPAAGELLPACSCPDQGHPCKHAAALGYETGRLLDADPWALLLLRGRAAEAVREEVARRSAVREGERDEARRDAAGRTRAVARPGAPGRPGTSGVPRRPGTSGARGRSRVPGARDRSSATGAREAAGLADSPSPGQQVSSTLPASEVFATSVRPPLPEPLPLPQESGEPGPFPGLPGAPSADALTFLATDAATRARLALAAVAAEGDSAPGEGNGKDDDPLPELSLWHDTVRLAATHPQLTGRRSLSPLFAALARSAGRDALELARAAAAWRQGGPAGLDVLETAWDPPAGAFDRGRSALAGLGITMTIHRNHLTHTTRPIQLRYGRDGRWYPYRAAHDEPPRRNRSTRKGRDNREDRRDWWPEGASAPDPVQALTGLREP